MPHDENILCRSFRGATGASEHFIVVKATGGIDFAAQVKCVEDGYRRALAQLGLAPETAVFRRIFLSDVMNQADAIRQSDLVDDLTAISIVQQPPLPDAKIELLAYHVSGGAPSVKHRLSPKHLLVERGRQRHLWSTRLCASDNDTSNSSEAQTREIFDDLIHTLETHGGTLRDHCVRTWIYMKGVDVFYKGMVDSRRELFEKHGLTGDTHYIASTGIEGAGSHRYDVVLMDAYSNLDLLPNQTTYLNDFDRLCPTKDYNVTFERGTRIAYADRAHHYISGTASIDKAGDVIHLGEVIPQLGLAIENVDALLRSGGATMADMMYLIVYLRDPADYRQVDAYLRRHLPELPAVIVLGAVCRPAWLIEIEGVAVAAHDDPTLPPF